MGNVSAARLRLAELCKRTESGIDWFAEYAFDEKWLERLGGYTKTTFHPRFSLRMASKQPHEHPLVCVFGIPSEKYVLLRDDEQRKKWRNKLISPQSGIVDNWRHVLNVFDIGEERARYLGFIPPMELDHGWENLHKAWVTT